MQGTKPKITTLKPRVQVAETRLAITYLGETERIRGTTLQNIRREHFAKYPLCVRCLAMKPERTSLATELDHKRPLHQGGTDTPANRQGLCDDCHLEKSKTERGHRYIQRSRG